MVARGGKTRLFAFVCVVLVLSAVLYVLLGTQVQLDHVRHSASLCAHKLESISSQLQDIVERKLEFERLLEDEKRAHEKTKEELNELIQDEKQLRDTQNVDSMNRYNEIKRSYEALQEEEKKMSEELETLRTKYQEKEKINEQLVQNLDTALSEIENLKNEKMKPDGGKENTDAELNSNLQKLNEKSSDNIINVSKLSSATPAINPQAIGATAKSSTPMIDSKLQPVVNESQQNEKNEANPINQPSMVISIPVKKPNNDVASKNENETSPSQESKGNGNEFMKAMPAPPQEDTAMKEKQIKKDDEYEQERFKEDEDDEDNDNDDFEARDIQHNE